MCYLINFCVDRVVKKVNQDHGTTLQHGQMLLQSSVITAGKLIQKGPVGVMHQKMQ